MWCYPGWEGTSSWGCSPHSSSGRGAWRQVLGFLWIPRLLLFLQISYTLSPISFTLPSPSYLLHPQRSDPFSALFRKPRPSLESTLSSLSPNQYKVRTVARAGGIIRVFPAVSFFHFTARFYPHLQRDLGRNQATGPGFINTVRISRSSDRTRVCLAPKPTFFATWAVSRPSLQSVKRGNRRVSTWTGESRLTAADRFL